MLWLARWKSLARGRGWGNRKRFAIRSSSNQLVAILASLIKKDFRFPV